MRHRNQQYKNIKWAMLFFFDGNFDFTFVEKLITFKFVIPIPFILLQDILTIITILWGNNLNKNKLVLQNSC